jgi:hypothetical protein
MINKIVKNENFVVNTDVEIVDGAEMEFAILFDIDEERMFYLNSTSYEIYKLLETPMTLSEIVDYFKNEYLLEQDDVESINQAVVDMLDKNIILCFN